MHFSHVVLLVLHFLIYEWQLKVWISWPSLSWWSEVLPFTTLRLHSHKSWRNAKHSSLANICLSFLLIAGKEVHVWWLKRTRRRRRRRRKRRRRRWALTGRVGPVGIGTGVGCRAVAPQGGVALAAMRRWDGEGTPKLAVRAGRWAQRGRRWDKPTTYWLHGESNGTTQE